jgi:hypothetical protein
MDDLAIAIAGLGAAIVTRDRDVTQLVHDRYKGFVSSGTPEWQLEIDVGPVGGGRAHDDVRVSRDGMEARYTVNRGDFAGTVDLPARRASVTLADANEYSLDSFLRILYSLALVAADGVIVHAASLVRNGRAHLFCGPSGSGKTTVARLSPDATLLSDELSIVRMSEARARCHGTPFWGELARAGDDRAAPLGGIFFLHHGARHALDPVVPRRAIERLLPNVLFFARDADLTAGVLDIAADLVEAVPCFDLSFRLDAGFWEIVDRV